MTTNAKLAEKVAGDGWLGTYLTYARGLTRAPALYHIMTGLGTLSGAVGSNVWWRGYGGGETWPNLYLLILGETGNAKTTAMKIGTRLLARAVPGSIFADEFSQERFVQELAKHPTMVLEIEEFATLLAMGQKSYNDGLKESLTKLYDPRDTFRRSLRGEHGKGEEIVVHKPSLTILGASTTDWLVSHLQEMDFRSGFMPRFLLCPQDENDREAEGDPNNVDFTTENLLARHLDGVARMERVQVGFDATARKHLSAFVAAHESESSTNPEQENMRGLVSRIGTYCAKVSALLCVADNGRQSEYVVTIEQARRTTALMEWLIGSTQQLFERQIVFDKFEKEAQKLLQWIPSEGISRSKLLKRSHKPSQEFSRMLDTLEQREQIKKAYIKPEGESKQSEWWFRAYPNTIPTIGNQSGTEGNSRGTDCEPTGNSNGVAQDFADDWVEVELNTV